MNHPTCRCQSFSFSPLPVFYTLCFTFFHSLLIFLICLSLLFNCFPHWIMHQAEVKHDWWERPLEQWGLDGWRSFRILPRGNKWCVWNREIQREREGGITEYVKGGNRESPPTPPLLKSSNSPSLGWPYLGMLLRLQMKFRDIEWEEGWTDCSFPPLFALSVKKEQRSDRR